MRGSRYAKGRKARTLREWLSLWCGDVERNARSCLNRAWRRQRVPPADGQDYTGRSVVVVNKVDDRSMLPPDLPVGAVGLVVGCARSGSKRVHDIDFGYGDGSALVVPLPYPPYLRLL